MLDIFLFILLFYLKTPTFAALIITAYMKYPILSAEEAAALIADGQTVGIGGFSSVGTPKAVPAALAKHAEALHNEGKPFKIGLITGGATGNQVDSALTEAHAVTFRTPFQSNKEMRGAINSGEVRYFDLHLSQIGQDVRYGFLGKIDVAIIEASDITPEGELILSTSVGISPTLACVADKVIVELNAEHTGKLTGMHDIFVLDNPPYRREIPIYKVNDRTGSISVKVDPKKVAGVVLTHERDQIAAFTPLNETTKQIGQNVADFLLKEYRRGAIPKEFLPLQSGVGNIANAVLGALGDDPHLPAFSMYTEVIQNSVIDLMMKDRIRFVAGSSLTLSDDKLNILYEHIDEMKDRVLLRPQEITNHPEVIRRLGIIAVNTALEADIFGNVNSTHVSGSKMMNGIGGSGDFARNAYLSIFTTRTRCAHPCHRARRGRPARQIAFRACPAHHRELRAPRLQAAALGLPETIRRQMPHPHVALERLPYALGIRRNRRYAEYGIQLIVHS